MWTDRHNIHLKWMFARYEQSALDDNTHRKSDAVCVRVLSCDISSQLSLLSAQWSCEFNLSGTINLSTAGCCLHVLAIMHMWSLTSIYGGDKRGVTFLQGTYGVLSTFRLAWFPHLSDLPRPARLWLMDLFTSRSLLLWSLHQQNAVIERWRAVFKWKWMICCRAGGLTRTSE